MTKAEFREQFKRLRVAGYRLPISDGVTVDDVLAEWFQTFGGCTVREFAEAIDRLKKSKADTFWPAPGELWAHVFEIRKAHRIRLQTANPDFGQDISPDVRSEMAAAFREFAAHLSQKMAMRHAPAQTRPQDVEDAEQLERDDRALDEETA